MTARSHTRSRNASIKRRRAAWLRHLGSNPKRGKAKRRRSVRRAEEIERTVEKLNKSLDKS